MKILAALLRERKHGHTVWAVEALECPNTQVQAGCLRSATGHLFEVPSFTWYCGESPRAKLQKVSSEERRTPFRGQAVNQSTEMPVCGFLRNSTVIVWTFTSDRSTERGSLFPFFVLATEAHEGPNTSRQSRESHGELWGISPFEVAESVIGRPKGHQFLDRQ